MALSLPNAPNKQWPSAAMGTTEKPAQAMCPWMYSMSVGSLEYLKLGKASCTALAWRALLAAEIAAMRAPQWLQQAQANGTED